MAFDSTNAVYREVAAVKTLAEGMPSTLKNKGMAEINNKKSKLLAKAAEKKAGVISKVKDKAANAMKFVKNILMIIAGVKAIKLLVTSIVSRELPKIELFIKKALKDQLKEMINCGSDPAIPDYLKQNGAGIDIKLSNTDFYRMFTMDPTTPDGALLYTDGQSGLASKDMHTFLYSVIQDDTLNGGTAHDWGTQTMLDPILSVAYSSQTPTAARVINVKASQFYTDNKSLTDFNNDYIDSLTILPTAQMFAQLIDSLFGVVSFKLKVPPDWLKKQEEVNKIVERMMDAEEDTVIDDSFFEFEGQDLWDIEEVARQRSKGIRYFVTCDNVSTSVSADTLLSQVTAIENAPNKQALDDIITTAFATIESEVTDNLPAKDKANASFEFFDKIFKAIGQTTANTILSPKLAILLQINNRIIYGTQAQDNLNSPKDYIFKNRVLYNAIIKAIKSILLSILLAYALKKLADLINKSKSLDIAEKIALAKAQLLSLVGIPPAIFKMMNMVSGFYSAMNDKIDDNIDRI